jgi:hypothetical protein
VTYDLRVYSVFSNSHFHFYGPREPDSARPTLERWAHELIAGFDTGCPHPPESRQRDPG